MDVVRINGGDGVGVACSCNCCSVIVAVCGDLGCTISLSVGSWVVAVPVVVVKCCWEKDVDVAAL